jgi:hypothetical protein
MSKGDASSGLSMSSLISLKNRAAMLPSRCGIWRHLTTGKTERVLGRTHAKLRWRGQPLRQLTWAHIACCHHSLFLAIDSYQRHLLRESLADGGRNLASTLRSRNLPIQEHPKVRHPYLRPRTWVGFYAQSHNWRRPWSLAYWLTLDETHAGVSNNPR